MLNEILKTCEDWYFLGAIALSYPPRVRVRATVKLSAAFFHDESSITINRGGYESANESAIAPFPADDVKANKTTRNWGICGCIL